MGEMSGLPPIESEEQREQRLAQAVADLKQFLQDDVSSIRSPFPGMIANMLDEKIKRMGQLIKAGEQAYVVQQLLADSKDPNQTDGLALLQKKYAPRG